MTVTSNHHTLAKEAFKGGQNTLLVKKMLQSKGLTKSQSNACCRTALKQLGLYKSRKLADAANAKRAKKEADLQATIKTEVGEDF